MDRATQRATALAMHDAQRQHVALAARQHVLLDQRRDVGGLKRVQVEFPVDGVLDLLAAFIGTGGVAFVVAGTVVRFADQAPFGCVSFITRSSNSLEYTRPTSESRAFFW
jgi:hypothetical protein